MSDLKLSLLKVKEIFNSSPLFVLTRHFFRRLFLNETVFFEEQMVAKVIGIIAILSIFPAYVADSLLFLYLLFPERGTAWAETALFTTIIMLFVGLITLFVWEVIFLDRRDYLNLTVLPLRPLKIFSAKFLSLVLFVGLFVAGLNSLSSFVFAIYLGESRAYGLLSGLALFMVHLLVMLAAGSFIFFMLSCISGLLSILLRGKIFRSLADILRFGLIMAHIFALYFFLIDTKWISHKYQSFQALKEAPTAFMMNFPPLWFTGLYQVLLGYREPFFEKLMARGLLALAASVGAFFLITLISYSRYLKKVSPEGAKHLRPSLLRRILEPVLNLTILRNKISRAIFWFYHSVLFRSRLHRNRILSYLAVGFGLTMIILVSSGKYFWKYHQGSILSLPLALSFFLLVGIREAGSIPVNFPAGWVFKISEAPEKWPYFSALRKCVFIFFILPLYLLLFVFYSLIWNWEAAAVHCLYDLALAVLLMEALFFQQKKFPFVCSYVPGKSKMHVLWLVYLASFLAYIYLPRWVEPEFLARPGLLIYLYLVLFLLLLGLNLYHRLRFYRRNDIIYEDQPEISPVELLRSA